MSYDVIDASVAVKWFLPMEAGRDDAVALLKQINTSPDHFAVPDLFYCEMLNVFCKAFSSAAEVYDNLITLHEFGMRFLPTGRNTLSQAAYLAKNYGLSGYDSIYAANAKLTGGKWITADERSHKKIQKLKISSLLGE